MPHNRKASLCDPNQSCVKKKLIHKGNRAKIAFGCQPIIVCGKNCKIWIRHKPMTYQCLTFFFDCMIEIKRHWDYLFVFAYWILRFLSILNKLKRLLHFTLKKPVTKNVKHSWLRLSRFCLWMTPIVMSATHLHPIIMRWKFQTRITKQSNKIK